MVAFWKRKRPPRETEQGERPVRVVRARLIPGPPVCLQLTVQPSGFGRSGSFKAADAVRADAIVAGPPGQSSATLVRLHNPSAVHVNVTLDCSAPVPPGKQDTTALTHAMVARAVMRAARHAGRPVSVRLSLQQKRRMRSDSLRLVELTQRLAIRGLLGSVAQGLSLAEGMVSHVTSHVGRAAGAAGAAVHSVERSVVGAVSGAGASVVGAVSGAGAAVSGAGVLISNSVAGAGRGVGRGVGELAGSAALWSRDQAAAAAHLFESGGRTEQLADLGSARLLPAPPSFEDADACRGCLSESDPNNVFSFTKKRHHCRHCGGSYCARHLRWRRTLHKFSGMSALGPQWVCLACVRLLQREDFENRTADRLLRCSDLVGGRELCPFVERLDDTNASRARRLGEASLQLAWQLPLGTRMKAAVASLKAARQLGEVGVAGVLLTEDLTKLVFTMRQLGESTKSTPAHERPALAGALYYLMAKRREERGCHPMAEEHAHAGCAELTEGELDALLELAPIPLSVAYEVSCVDMQRHARLLNYSFLFAELRGSASRPCFCLVGCPERKRAVLAVRGTKEVCDLVTDAHAQSVRFCGGWAHAGMARAARWLRSELRLVLGHLAAAGYDVILTGHSLGAGVAALLTVLLKRLVPGVRCVGYATPPVAGGARLLRALGDCCTSLVHRNDAVPRMTLTSLRSTIEELVEFTEWREDAMLDIQAVVDRAKGCWAPQLRSAPSEEGPASEVPHERDEARRGEAPAQIVDEPAAEAERAAERAAEKAAERAPERAPESASEVAPEAVATGELAGAVVGEAAGEEANAEERDEERDEEDLFADEDDQILEDVEDEEATGVDGEQSTPILRVPGRVLHLYTTHGVYRGAWVPADLPTLCELQLAPHMLTDHLSANYTSALRACKAARTATQQPPEWVPFDKAPNSCSCCKARFSWEGTFRSKSHELCARHHCRGCGRVVCDACSRRRQCLPQFGIMDAVRVCDACVYKI